jgi:hypothetical protein
MREDFQEEPVSLGEEEEVADVLNLEESEFEEENAYLVQDDELSEEFQFQS